MYHLFSRLLFIIGFLLGMFFACLTVILTNKYNNRTTKISELSKFPNNINYNKWILKNGLKINKVPIDSILYSHHKYLLESQYLYDKIKILCLILVKSPKNGEAARATWAQSCNRVELIDLHIEKKRVIMPVMKNKQHSSWKFLCNKLLHIESNFDWILIVNDNTFAILENLRLLVAPLDPIISYYLGHAVKFWGINYNTGSAGYTINNSTLNVLKRRLHRNNSCITETTFLNKEDFYLGKLLSSLSIFPEDTNDPLGLTTFHSYNWQQEFFTDLNAYKTSVYPATCCSSQSITFQATEADKIYMYHYLLYNLHVFLSGNLGSTPAATPVPQDQVWKSFLKEHGFETNNVSPEQYYKIWENVVHDPSEFAKEMQNLKYEYK